MRTKFVSVTNTKEANVLISNFLYKLEFYKNFFLGTKWTNTEKFV